MKVKRVTELKHETTESLAQLRNGLSQGERAVLEGRTYNHSQARDKMSKWLKVSESTGGK